MTTLDPAISLYLECAAGQVQESGVQSRVESIQVCKLKGVNYLLIY